MATLKNLIINDTSFNLPTGTTAQRPGSPSTGATRYNTDHDVIEYYNGSGWVAFDGKPRVRTSAGVTTEDQGTHLVYVFTGDGTLTVDCGGYIEYLIVGGGGGGAGSTPRTEAGGGGGGGGVIHKSGFISNGSYPVVVGEGGGSSDTVNQNTAGNGGNSSIFGETAFGGGGAGSQNIDGANGGSGGGGGGIDGSEAATVGGLPTDWSQGSQGGGTQTGVGDFGAGGGGAGTAGWSCYSTINDYRGRGDGGWGLYFPQFKNFGDDGWFAGGGGAGTNYGSGGVAYKGGGTAPRSNVITQLGRDVSSPDATIQAGGGGGGSDPGGTPGDGGAGIVIVRFLNPEAGA